MNTETYGSQESMAAWPDSLIGTGEMGARIRWYDWSKTSLGPIMDWPQHLRTAVNICLGSAFASYVWWGPNLLQVYNDSCRDILRDRHPKALGQPAQEVWSEIWSTVAPLIEQVMSRGETVRGDDLPVTLTRDGTRELATFTFSYSPIHNIAGHAEGVFITAIETTQQLKAEEELREMHLLLEEALASGGVVAWVWDIHKNRLKGSATFAHLFGVDPAGVAEGFPLETYVEAIHEEDRERVLEEVARAVETGEKYAADYRVRNAEGEVRWLAVRGHVEYDAKGEPLKFPGVLVDITERKNAEAAARKLELELDLEEHLTNERRRLGRELHDSLRQELVGIQMIANSLSKRLAARSVPEAAMLNDFSDLIADVNIELRRLINGLVPVNIDAESLLPALERAAANIEQCFDLPSHIISQDKFTLPNDEVANHLYHIAVEAMTNAAKYAKATRIDVSLRVAGGALILEIRDDGVGLPEDFEKRGGMGIANLRARAELIGAHIDFDSDPKTGTVVTCRLAPE